MIIYKTTNLINGKIYVGQTKSENQRYLGSGKLLKRAIKKNGPKNFKREILCRCFDQESLNKMEQFWILELNSQDPKIGYNLDKGGTGRENYESVSKKNSRKCSPETRAKIAAAHRGKKMSDEAKANMSKARKGKTWEEIYGKEQAAEKRAAMSENLKGNTHTLGHEPWNKGLSGYKRNKQ